MVLVRDSEDVKEEEEKMLHSGFEDGRRGHEPRNVGRRYILENV
jgi:hypothetical protein